MNEQPLQVLGNGCNKLGLKGSKTHKNIAITSNQTNLQNPNNA